ncbi:MULTISPECIES: bifunctional folylpolyglutamate synthase/dihydrofolate synthase [Staphylococcus]|jgi:dihydrofolate synthase/folylpolyglutamate synthase|uniref:Dihydrofolate synthase/folylpolyglutamate synthase n=1 Tax=Staphylococcus nepalensis TaxID=214473 RepID=A0A291JKG7_9STAP|nr:MULTISPECIES: folylpolyglutamate synthase/dihydrofolate synthase family protein [Staphylococcus]VDG66876.1 folylpolyglutamate synthetase FolC [Lacrimispora indolis]ATH59897.1 bifunctional folylpolyglutamate synthase/dihydrofolate synthase [Staphylococcus nepalensis]ATH64988.1 bifunctional folylpolyglutamate synthase/dihydrofolate synthase [Staphylococcus nepalensis]AWI44354.1 bifunctional folylpolyglutamate synthase/dihydrofolate synthase [Staphylococcus nepalensis]MBO1213292.1 bifunctional
MNYLDSLYWIHERTKFGIKPGVKRMEWMLNRLNNPQFNINGIHVGGTNGKGSTVAYLRSALVDNGYEVGTFTSPFIETFNERISLNGTPISDDAIVALVQKVKPVSEALEIETELGTATEFEIITTMMFLYFGEIHPVDFVIVEAGLGIKNDSTNVFKPILSILTSIGLDHVDILGDTYVDIAKDKGAIVKPDTPVIYAVKNEDALKVIRDFVEQQNAEGIELDRDISVISQGDEFTYRYKNYELETLILNMLGEHQKENAALAITALIELNESGLVELDFNKMIDGIESVNWTGRIEKVKDQPLMIIDGAHNLESVEALIKTLKDYYKLESVDILYAAIKGKPIHSMVDQLKTVASTFYVTDFDFPKACTKETIYDEIRFEQKETIDDFVQFIENYNGSGLVITGSLYFISEVKSKVNF